MSARTEARPVTEWEIKFRDRLIRTIHRREKLRKARKQRRKYRLVVVIQTGWSLYKVIGPWGEVLVSTTEGHVSFQLLDTVVRMGGIDLNMFDMDGRWVG